jgi:tRNA modification GTPase
VTAGEPNRTWVACLTPPGRAAIATVGLCGPQAWELIRQRFQTRSGKALPETPTAGRFWLGRAGAASADEVVLAVKGMQPLPWLELHGHGGREVVRLLLEEFERAGCLPCSWRDFLNHTGEDFPRGQAAVALASATTTRTAAILLDQYHGAFGAALSSILAALDRGDHATAEERLAELARFAPLGRRLTAPWRVVVAGAPNVGKSSLVNALAGYQRSVVAPTPGTTRDVVSTRLAIDGWPVELIDTAGLRTDAGTLEKQGIELARRQVAQADLCLWLLDASALPIWPDVLASQVRLVVNKVDVPPAWDLNQAVGALRVSAQTGEGLPELCAILSRWLVPDLPGPGAAVTFTQELTEAIEDTRRLLTAGKFPEARLCLVGCFRGPSW